MEGKVKVEIFIFHIRITYHMYNLMLIAFIMKLTRKKSESFCWPNSDHVFSNPTKTFAIEFIKAIGCSQGHGFQNSNRTKRARLKIYINYNKRILYNLKKK